MKKESNFVERNLQRTQRPTSVFDIVLSVAKDIPLGSNYANDAEEGLPKNSGRKINL